MEHRELLLNRIVSNILILILFLMIGGCSYRTAGTGGINIPAKDVTAGDPMLVLKKGKLYYGEELFSGKVCSRYPNGDTASVTPYISGLEHGLAEAWYPGGIKKEERYYFFGKKEGEHRSWWSSGSLKYILNFKNDIYEGSQKEWHQNGQLYTEFNYTAGYENGLQREWDANGKLRANYVVKDNRKYGLTGTKGCKTFAENDKN